MRRSLCLLFLLSAFMTVVPAARGGDPQPGSDAPTSDQLLERILSDSSAEQAMVAQYLRRADDDEVIELFERIRARILPPPPTEQSNTLFDVARRMREKGKETTVPLISVTVRTITCDAGVEDVLLALESIQLGAEPLVIDRAQAARLLLQFEQHSAAWIVSAPTVMVPDGETASVQMLDQFSCVTDWDIVTGRTSQVVDPVVTTLQDGFVLVLSGKLDAARKAVRVKLRGTWAQVTRPIPVTDVSVPGIEQPLKIHHPDTRLACRDADVVIPSSASALLQGPVLAGGRHSVLMIEADVKKVGEPFLAEIERKPPPQPTPGPVVHIETRILEVAAAKMQEVLGAEAAADHTTVTYLDDADVAALLARVEAEAGAKVVSAPRVTVYDRQKANVSMLNQVSYVQDYDLEIVGGSTLVGDPIIGTLQEGIVLDLTPTLSADRKHATLEMTATLAHIARPIPDFETTVGGQEVTIQIPELEVTRSRSTIRLPDGGSMLVLPQGPSGVKAQPALLVRLQVMDLK